MHLDALNAVDVATARTRLRPARPHEAAMVHGWTQDPAVQPWWGGSGNYPTLGDFTDDWPAHFFDGSRPAGGRVLVIEVTDPGEGGPRPIGILAVNEVDTDNQSAEIDVLIGDGALHGRGLGTEAVGAALDALFGPVGLHRVWLVTYEANARARACYERAGFTLEGRLRESERVDGRWVDGVVYGVLAGDPRPPPR